ncbi:phage minor head protein [Mesorhizobium sp. KR1-2]|uniref:phage minor head protein n=1 Tax=Mesorhizobium sp. KR1-2 TaxID=3156609 RepID=UPI0032B344A5
MTGDNKERGRRFDRERQKVLREGVAIQRDTADQLKTLLGQAEKRIAKILKAAPSDFRHWQLTELQRQVRAELAKFQPDAVATLNAGLDRSHATGQGLVDRPLMAGGVDISGDLMRLDVRKLDATRVFMVDRVKDISEQAAAKITTDLAMAVTGVLSPEDVAKNVAGVLQDGGMKRARTIVRTELGRAFSEAAQERQTQAQAILPGLKKQWRRSGKIHSRFEHDAIDGQIRDVDQPFDLPNGVRLMYPRDPAGPIEEVINCGCSSIPYMESWTVMRPGRQQVTDDERARSRGKRIISDAFE